jgi:hypothetical protein
MAGQKRQVTEKPLSGTPLKGFCYPKDALEDAGELFIAHEPQLALLTTAEFGEPR